jgi:hypothetical protein
VTVVPGVLLDHVVDHAARRHLGVVGSAESHVQRVQILQDGPGDPALLPPPREGLGNIGVRDRIEVGVGLSLGTPDPPNGLSREAPAEPASLDLGRVADKSEQGEVGGGDRRRLELGIVEPLTLPGQGGSLILKETRQGRSLIPVPRRVGSLPKHGSIIVTSADVGGRRCPHR